MNDAEQRALLESCRPWLRFVARQMCERRPGWIEDLMQEGWIEAWRATRTYDPSCGPSRDTWLRYCARRRMHHVMLSWQAQCRDWRITDLIDEIPDDVAPMFVPEEMVTAYHDGELLSALNQLSPRERRYVELRFWAGMSTSQMRGEFDHFDPPTLPAWQWIRPKLRATLEGAQ